MMPGDGNTSITNPYVVALFHHSLSVQFGWIAGLALVIVGFIVFFQMRHAPSTTTEARSRTFLRWSFGLFWVIDGLLQFQPAMPLGLANDVVAPAADGTPFWLHSLMYDGINVWNRYPIALAAATAWIQLGIGLLILSSRGRASRIAGAVSVGWGLLVWVVGNGMGGIFSTDASFLFGWPGAVAFYVIAGVWLALPERMMPEPFSKVSLRLVSVILGVGVILQMLPDHQFWHGGHTNALTAMATSMTQSAQPHWFASLVNEGATVASAMGGGFNIVVILWMGLCAFGLWQSSAASWRWPIYVFVGGCVVWWIFAQDAAFFGGLSTDVNSMLPVSALVLCASPMVRSKGPVALPLPELSRRTFATFFGGLAVAFLVVALIPMIRTSVSSGAETTQFIVQNGQVEIYPTGSTAFPFTFTDQHGHVFSFPTANGKYTLLTWLDPVCWTDCPLLAAQLKALDAQLTPSQRDRLQIVAVAADPYHEQVRDIHHFIAQHQLGDMDNFFFVTGTREKLAQNYNDYGITVSMKRTDRMSIHTDVMYVIDPHGQIRASIPDDPPNGQSGTTSAVTVLAQTLTSVGFK